MTSSQPDARPLVTVYVETLTGSDYVFPDVSPDIVERLPEAGRTPSYPTLQLVNISFSLLSVPWLVVRRVRIEEKVVWECPALAAAKQ
jgi:hypothetical protein